MAVATKTKPKPATKSRATVKPAPTATPLHGRNRSITALIEHQRKSYARRAKAVASEAALTISVPEIKPYGIMLMGDPHLDNPGCNWPRLLADLDILDATDGAYCINLGDTIDNWPMGGKLAKKWADSGVTRSESYQLAEWLYTRIAPKLLLTIAGNHDAWDGGAEILSRVHSRSVPFMDWHANFALKARKGVPIRVIARHDFPGHSFWNGTHGGSRAARLDYDADLFVSGHRHQYAMQQFEVHRSGSVATVVAAGSYKTDDEYARRCGYRPSNMGASTMVIVDPSATTPDARLMHFASLASGAKVLAAMRK